MSNWYYVSSCGPSDCQLFHLDNQYRYYISAMTSDRYYICTLITQDMTMTFCACVSIIYFVCLESRWIIPPHRQMAQG